MSLHQRPSDFANAAAGRFREAHAATTCEYSPRAVVDDYADSEIGRLLSTDADLRADAYHRELAAIWGTQQASHVVPDDEPVRLPLQALKETRHDHGVSLAANSLGVAQFIEGSFTADISATRRDDGRFWLDLPDHSRLAVALTSDKEDEHVPGDFPSYLWHGHATFTRTSTGLWLVTLHGTVGADHRPPFTVVVYSDDCSRDRGPEKVCRKCLNSRPVAMFTPRKRSDDGLQKTCIDCSEAVPLPRIGKAPLHSNAKGNRSRRTTGAGRAQVNALVTVRPGWKACPGCLKAKPATAWFFVPDGRTTDGFQHRCRSCSGTVPGLLYARGKGRVPPPR